MLSDSVTMVTEDPLAINIGKFRSASVSTL